MTRGVAREIAHDLNNVLTATIGIAEAILSRPGVDARTRADVEAIREGARRGGALIKRRLGLAGAPPEPIATDNCIRMTARLIAHRLADGMSLKLDLADPEGWTRADPACLDRILLNLVANARHAMPGGGTVTLSTRHRAIEREEPRVPDTIPPGDYVVVAVVDTGAGIPAGILARVLQPGFTTRSRQGGSGLGLASVHAAARECLGFLSMESVEGQGTRIEVYLPRETARPASVPSPGRSRRARARPGPDRIDRPDA